MYINPSLPTYPSLLLPLVTISLFSASVIYRPLLTIKIAVTHGATGKSHSKPVVGVQSLNCVLLFATPWAAAHQASLTSTVSWSLPKFMSTEPVIISNYLILCCPCFSCLQPFPASGSFPMSWNNKDRTVNTWESAPSRDTQDHCRASCLGCICFNLNYSPPVSDGAHSSTDNTKCGFLDL